MAGELATDYDDKKIILITRNNELVESASSSSLSTATLDLLNAKNIEIIFNDSIDLRNVQNFTRQRLRTSNGQYVEFDAYLQCYGSKPNTLDCIRNPHWLDSKGFIKVNSYLQVGDCQNIFAIGDCSGVNESKMIYSAIKQSANAAYNIHKLLTKDEPKLKAYKAGGMSVVLLSMGRDSGILQVGRLITKGFLPRVIKSKNLLIDYQRKKLKF